MRQMPTRDINADKRSASPTTVEENTMKMHCDTVRSALRAAQRRHYQALGFALVVVAQIWQPAFAADRIFSAPSRSDFAYSVARDTLYIANGNEILRYQVSTGAALPPIPDPFGTGSLRAVDISIDDRTLAISQTSFSVDPSIALVDLDSLAVTPVPFTLEPNEFGSADVAWGNDGRLLVSAASFGFFDAPLRRYDPVSGSITIIGRVDSNTALDANADRSVIAIEAAMSTTGNIGLARYSVADQSLLITPQNNFFGSSVEFVANRDGSQYALITTGVTAFHDAELVQFGGTLGEQNGGRPLAAAYDPGQAIVYLPWAGTRQVRAFDTSSFEEVGRFTFDVRFPNFAFDDAGSRTRVSSDGQWLFAQVSGGVVAVPTSEIDRESTPDPADLPNAEDAEATTLEDQQAFIFLPANDPTGSNFPDFEVARLPQNGTVDVSFGFARYQPNPDFFGTDSFTYTLENDAGISREATVTIVVMPVNDAPSYSLNRQLYRTALGGIRRTDRDAVLDITPGPANEADQQVAFAVSNNNPALFIEQPSISQAGVLTYRPRLFGRGEATVTVTGIDSGGIARNGSDRGPTMSFRIDIR